MMATSCQDLERQRGAKKVPKSVQNNQNQQKLEKVFRSPNAKRVSFCSRDLPPPPPQFDDPPPAAGLEQFVRGRKFFLTISLIFSFLSHRIIGRRVHNADNIGHSELWRKLPASQLSTSLPGVEIFICI